MQGGRAKVKQKMQDGRAKKCKMVEQKNVRWSSKRRKKKEVRWSSKTMQDGGAEDKQKM
jgi:hypothetical protein